MLRPIRDAIKRGAVVEQIDQDWQRGLLSDKELIELQRAVMPRCEVCGVRPCVVRTAELFCCEICFEITHTTSIADKARW